MVIESVAFRNFKALRNTRLVLAPFNLVIGPNGSGKTSLIEALLRLRTLARLPLGAATDAKERGGDGPEIRFRFAPPHDGWEALVSCSSDDQCDLLQLIPLENAGSVQNWPALRTHLQRVRAFLFDHQAIAQSRGTPEGASELTSDAGNLAAVLAHRRQSAPALYEAWRQEVIRALPEYRDVRIEVSPEKGSVLALQLIEDERWVSAVDLSQGTLYALAIFALAFDPNPPSVICIEELDRGLHPRMLRETRDALYRLSYPKSFGLTREPVQIVVTTHSPYLVDLFRDHPEEIVIADKQGSVATFARLSDRADISELLAEGSLGDLWFSGILGGVPGSK